ncbi:MAG: PAS domain-containing sensor histidine kinase [Leptolyngbya sp. Prado105]|jgi:PAS domain S-box-containing protein|nr:PAS domain-containing sensor histidine kinase [Leptolyngbya sp. Prado105]
MPTNQDLPDSLLVDTDDRPTNLNYKLQLNFQDSIESGALATVGMVLQLADGQIAACNPTAERIMGITMAQMAGWRSTDSTWRVVREDGSAFPGEQHPAMVALRTGKPCQNVVMGFYRPSGNIVWLLLNAQPLFQQGIDQPYAVLTTLVETPPPAQAQNRKNQSKIASSDAFGQYFIQHIAEAVPGILYVYDLIEQRNIYINHQVQEVLGYSPAVIQAFEAGFFDRILHPDDLEGLLRHYAQFKQSQPGTVDEYEYRMRDAQGNWRWFLSRDTVFRYTPDGQVWQILGTAQDITERKRVEENLSHSEERYRCLVECIPQLIWTANSDGHLQDTNHRWLDYTGLTLEQAQGDGWLESVHPDDREALLQVWHTARQQKSSYQAECRLRSRSGDYRWFLVKAMPVKDQQGNVSKWYGTSTDIDDHKQLALERLHALELEQIARTEAEKANYVKDELLMLLSHELRTPLNPILGWCRLLQMREFSSAEIMNAIVTIERNAQRQRQVVEDLLDVAKLMRGSIHLKLGWVNVAEVIEAVLSNLTVMADVKQIEIDADLDASIQPILGDAARLQQIVWSLLSNAIKFTPEGGRISIHLKSTQTAVELKIIDTGVGIDHAFLPHVFDLFRQSNSSTSRPYDGLGLGLTLVRHLVELHGGTIEVESTGCNEGATFTVCFPFVRA